MVEDSKVIENGIIKFRPKARLLNLLGHELITDEVIAMIELVKNSYDADANHVNVELTDVTKKSGGKIEIKDNGHGMTLDIVKQAWMELARDNKKNDKGGKTRTNRFNRLPLGEKGIGRFSVDKLGLRLELITRFCEFDKKTKEVSFLSDEEVVLIIEGKKFIEDSYLDELECEWITRKPVEFEGNEHGTILRISDLRSNWSDDLVEKVRLGLSRLSSPFSKAQDFEMFFISNEFSEMSTKIENPLLKIAPWSLDADIDENGIMEFTVKGQDENKSGKTDLKKPSNRFLIKGVEKGQYRKPTCGPFKFKLYAFSKWKKDWKKYGMDKSKIDLLNALCGVSIYRDGFRILPYGEHGNDWLVFDKRRVQKPGQVLGNDRVIGYVEISRDGNPYLKDKTNREGLIEEGNAFHDLQELAISATNILELFRHESIPHQKRSKAKTEEGKEDIETGRKSVEDTSSNIRENLDSVNEKLETGDLDGVKSDIGEVKKETEKSTTAAELIKIGTTKILEELKESDDQIENLISLSGIGMTAERMTHELSNSASNAKKLIKTTVKLLDSGKADGTIVKSNLMKISGQLNIIIDHIRQMEPLYYSKRRNTEKLDVGEIASDMQKFYSSTLLNLKIGVEIISETPLFVEMNKGHLMQIFNNLFDNSFFWLEHAPPEGQSRIIIKISGNNEKSLIFADNGPGVESHVDNHVFDPFVSTKPEGRGLGLYIVEDILQNYKAEIELLNDEKILEGANFKIIFPEVNK